MKVVSTHNQTDLFLVDSKARILYYDRSSRDFEVMSTLENHSTFNLVNQTMIVQGHLMFLQDNVLL